MEGGGFMCVKVILDVSLPLCRGRLISLEKGEKHWVSFKYDQLPNICYWCGCLDHDDKDCSLQIRSKGILSPNQKQYSQSLRAAPYRSSNKPVIYVLGYYENFDTPISRKMAEKGTCSVPTGQPLAKTAPVADNLDMASDIHDGAITDDELQAKNVAQAYSEPTIGYECSAKSTPHVNLFLPESGIPGITPVNHGDFLDKLKAHKLSWGPKNTSQLKDGDPFLIKLKETARDLQKFDDLLSKSDEAESQMANLPLPKSCSDFPEVATEIVGPFKASIAHSSCLLTKPMVNFFFQV